MHSRLLASCCLNIHFWLEPQFLKNLLEISLNFLTKGVTFLSRVLKLKTRKSVTYLVGVVKRTAWSSTSFLAQIYKLVKSHANLTHFAVGHISPKPLFAWTLKLVNPRNLPSFFQNIKRLFMLDNSCLHLIWESGIYSLYHTISFV